MYETSNARKNVVGKPECKSPLDRPNDKREVIIKNRPFKCPRTTGLADIILG
jgi:hypothetical protein